MAEKEKEEMDAFVEDGQETGAEADTASEERVLSKEEAAIKELTEKLAEQLDRYQRTLAEFDNFRKRTAKEKASMYDDGVKDTVLKLLPVVDNLERAMKTQEASGAENSLLLGIKMVYKQWMETFQAMGVTPIAAEGEQFDPNLHAAVAHEESDEYGENTVMLEMQKGYMYKDRVVRHSMVKVAN